MVSDFRLAQSRAYVEQINNHKHGFDMKMQVSVLARPKLLSLI